MTKTKPKPKPKRPDPPYTSRGRRRDSWAQGMTGLGSPIDKSTANYFARAPRLTATTLDAMYEGDGMLARIVDHVADELVRPAFHLESRGGSPFDWTGVEEQLDECGIASKAADAKRWARLYGGALLVFDVDDGMDPRVPLNLDRVRSLRDVVVVESEFAWPARGRSMRSTPDVWEIGEGVTPIRRIHASRVVRFDGVRLSPSARARNTRNGWGPSVLDRVWSSVARFGIALGYAGNILHEISIPQLKIAGLRRMLSAKDATGAPIGRETVQEVITAIKESIDALHLFAIDKDDEFENKSRDVSGIATLFDLFERDITSQTDMPKEVIFNVSPAGLNTGELAGPVRLYYDRVVARRGDEVIPAIKLAARIFAAARRAEPPPFRVVFEPQWQPTATELEQARLARAQADQIYSTVIGAVTGAQVQRARFVESTTGGFAIDSDEIDPLEEPEDPEVEATELKSSDYEPPDVPMSPAALSARFGVTPAILRGMYKRGEIGAWVYGTRWRYSPTEVAKASRRAPGSAPPASPPASTTPAPAVVAPPIGPRPPR